MHWHRPQLFKQNAATIGIKIKNKWYLRVFTRVNPYVTDEINGKYIASTQNQWDLALAVEGQRGIPAPKGGTCL